MSGRFHRYEGHPLSVVTLPVRVMKAMGHLRQTIGKKAGLKAFLLNVEQQTD